jgi:hypothetical protein
MKHILLAPALLLSTAVAAQTPADHAAPDPQRLRDNV